MSIATAITDLSGRIQDAYTALSAKGATMPATKDSYHLSATVDSIPNATPMYGIDGKGVFGEIQNGSLVEPNNQQHLEMVGLLSVGSRYSFWYGLYAAKGISSVSFPDLTAVSNQSFNYFGSSSTIKSLSMPKLSSIPDGSSTTQGVFPYAFRDAQIEEISFPSLTSVGKYGLSYFATNSNSVRKIELSNLVTVKDYGMEFFCKGTTTNNNIKSLDFPNLTSVGKYGFDQAFTMMSLSSVSFPKLKSIGEASFRCAFGLGSSSSKVDSLEFPELTAIPNQAFTSIYSNLSSYMYCNNVYFPKVTSIVASNYTLSEFGGATTVDDQVNIYLPKCTSISQGYLFYPDQHVTLHFAAANQTAIQALAGYSTKWNANADSQVLFDL